MIIQDKSGQASTELILLMGGIIAIVLIAITTYKDYLTDFASEIKNNEANNIINKIDEINELLKGD